MVANDHCMNTVHAMFWISVCIALVSTPNQTAARVPIDSSPQRPGERVPRNDEACRARCDTAWERQMNYCSTLPREQMYECRRRAKEEYVACLKACPRGIPDEDDMPDENAGDVSPGTHQCVSTPRGASDAISMPARQR